MRKNHGLICSLLAGLLLPPLLGCSAGKGLAPGDYVAEVEHSPQSGWVAPGALSVAFEGGEWLDKEKSVALERAQAWADLTPNRWTLSVVPVGSPKPATFTLVKTDIPDNPDVLGYTDSLKDTRTGEIVQSRLTLNGYIDQETLAYTLEHEWGHALEGMYGHSKVPGDIMYLTPTIGLSLQFSSRDVRSARKWQGYGDAVDIRDRLVAGWAGTSIGALTGTKGVLPRYFWVRTTISKDGCTEGGK